MAQGFNVSSLSEYKMPATELLRSAVLFSEDIGRFSVETGIQHKKYLNYIDAQPVLQAGNCGLGASGVTTFAEKEITVKMFAFRDQWCIDDLNEKDLNFGTGTLNGKMTPDLHTALFTDETDKIKRIVDKAIFQGATASGDLINGFITLMEADSDVVDLTSTGVTISNIATVLEGMVALVPEEVEIARGQLQLHMPLSFFNLYKQNRINANMYHDNPNTNNGLVTQPMFGWSNITLVAEPGLSGTKSMFLTWNKNMVVGTDELQEVSQAKMYFDENTDYVKYKSSFKLGTSYKFGAEIVYFKGL